MKVTDTRHDVLMSALHRWSRDTHVEIYKNWSFGEKRQTYGVNWAAIGTVSAEETRAFAENLLEAAKFVDALNALDIEIKYEADTDEADADITSREEWDAACCRVTAYLTDGNVEALCKFLANEN